MYRAKFPTQWMQGGAIDAESAWFNLTDRDTGKDVPFIGTTKGNAALTRVHGGRGTETTSETFCETDGGYCAPGGRLGASGSVEAKLEALDELLDLGVDVARYGPDDAGGYEWHVTFLDAAPGERGERLRRVDQRQLPARRQRHGRQLRRPVRAPAHRDALRAVGRHARRVHGHDPGRPVGRLGPRERPAVLRARDRRQQRRVLGPQAAGAPSKPMTTPGPPTSVVL